MTMMISEVTFNKIFPHAVKGVYQAISAQIVNISQTLL